MDKLNIVMIDDDDADGDDGDDGGDGGGGGNGSAGGRSDKQETTGKLSTIHLPRRKYSFNRFERFSTEGKAKRAAGGVNHHMHHSYQGQSTIFNFDTSHKL